MLSYLRLMSLVVRTSSLSASDCKEKTKRKKLCPKTNVTSNAKWVYVLDSIIGYGAPRKCSIIIRDEYLHKYCRVRVCPLIADAMNFQWTELMFVHIKWKQCSNIHLLLVPLYLGEIFQSNVALCVRMCARVLEMFRCTYNLIEAYKHSHTEPE